MSERAHRNLRIAGAVALVGALIAFIVSFLAGIGGASDARVTGDAQRGGDRLDQLGPRVRVEVLNASGVSGLARRATEHLRDRGFDVVYLGNAGATDQQTTVVIARTASIDAAQRVAAALGTDSVALEPDPQLYLDATVRLGKDWPPVAEPDDADRSGLWSRFRRSDGP